MKSKKKGKNNKIFLNKIKKYIILFIIFLTILLISNILKKKDIKVALCTMGKQENLYIQEFIEYYIKLGIDQIFIYDDNDYNKEKINNEHINKLYKKYLKIYRNIKLRIKNQIDAFTECYNNNKNQFDWFLMVDMDEFLVIVNDKLKTYLSRTIFNKCDFIKINWIIPTDNNLLYYDKRPLFERFKGPYKKSIYIKSIIRGNISNLKYYVHSPYYSPQKNITCNNIGKIINYKNINFESINKINIRKAYIIHYKYKSTEEYINKCKRGYGNWFGSKLKDVIDYKIKEYFEDNIITKEKIDFFEKELKINLTKYK